MDETEAEVSAEEAWELMGNSEFVTWLWNNSPRDKTNPMFTGIVTRSLVERFKRTKT